MTAPVLHRITCRLCDSQELELVLPLAATPIADAYVTQDQLGTSQPLLPLDVYWCHNCGHLQLLDVVDPELLFREYIYSTSNSPGLVDHFERYANDIVERFRPAPGALAVDIGSNDGTLLRFLKQRQLHVLGVDPASDVARRASDAGIETIPSFFGPEVADRIRQDRGAAAIVTANNVFAHADDLAGIATGVRELLAPDGVFVFEVSYLRDLMDNMVFDSIYHEHLDYHSVLPLQTFFDRLGMQLIDVRRASTKGGSIRVVAQRADGARQRGRGVDEMIAEEQEYGLNRAETYQRFAEKIDMLGQRVRDLLCGMRASGKSIVGYGASATTTTLLYHFQIGELLDFLVDDNPLRDGRYSPGLHIPVRASSAMYERGIDCAVVCAWRYADSIIGAHHELLNRGGQFVVPLPELVVRSR